MATVALAASGSHVHSHRQHVAFLYRSFWYCMHSHQWELAAAIFCTVLRSSPLDKSHWAKDAHGQAEARSALPPSWPAYHDMVLVQAGTCS